MEPALITMAQRTPPANRFKENTLMVARGAMDSFLLASMRWRTIRTPLGRWGLVGGILFLLLGLFATINLGVVVLTMAQQGKATAAGIFALSWLGSMQNSDIGNIGAITLGGALAAAVLAPFTGSSTLTLAPTEDLQSLRLSRLHRFFDSLAINCFSGIGLIQLLALTGITSVLSVGASRGPAMLITWMVWISVICLTTTLGWTLEWVLRRWGLKSRWQLGIAIATGIIIAVMFDPNHGSTVFGVGTIYSAMVDSAGSGTVIGFLIPAFGMMLIIFTVILSGLFMTRQAMSRPATVQQQARSHRARAIPKDPMNLATRLLTDILWRTPEVRRPILALIVIGIPGLLLLDMTSNLEMAILFAVPLAVALAAGVNLFGVVGAGMSWLASQPRVLSHFYRAAGWVQFLATVLIMMTFWLTSFLAGRTTIDSGIRFLVGSVVAGSISTVISMFLTIQKPIRARLSGRGDSLVPPLTALGYMMWLLILACWPASAVAGAYYQVQFMATAGALLLLLIAMYVLDRRFANPHVRSRIVAEVTAT